MLFRSMSPWLAVAKALNPLEVLEGVVAAFTGKAGGKRAYRMQESYGMVHRQSSEEDLVSKPVQSHPPEYQQQGQWAQSTESAGSSPIGTYDSQNYHSQGGRAEAYSPPRYGA